MGAIRGPPCPGLLKYNEQGANGDGYPKTADQTLSPPALSCSVRPVWLGRVAPAALSESDAESVRWPSARPIAVRIPEVGLEQV